MSWSINYIKGSTNQVVFKQSSWWFLLESDNLSTSCTYNDTAYNTYVLQVNWINI